MSGVGESLINIYQYWFINTNDRPIILQLDSGKYKRLMIWLLIHPYMIHPPTHPSDHHSLNHSYLNRSNILQPSQTHTHTRFSSSGKVRRCASLCAGIAIRQKSHATQLQQFMKVNPNFEALLSALLCNLRPGTLKHRTVNDTRIQTIRCPPPLVIA